MSKNLTAERKGKGVKRGFQAKLKKKHSGEGTPSQEGGRKEGTS